MAFTKLPVAARKQTSNLEDSWGEKSNKYTHHKHSKASGNRRDRRLQDINKSKHNHTGRNTLTMENPHESIQNNIISRIITNMDRLNNNVLSMNQELIKTNKNLNSLKNLGELLENYHNTVQYNLEVSGNKEKPL